MTIRLRYLTWKLRALCWVLRRLRGGGAAHSFLVTSKPARVKDGPAQREAATGN
jgi:hypothetical protein